MLRHCFALIAACAFLSCEVRAQVQADPLLATAEVAAPSGKTLPDDFKLNMLIRSTVIAINQANKTANYTVLRDLGSPRFKEANSAAKLAKIFEALRKSKFDLSPVLFFTPTMLHAPTLADSGEVRLTGFFDTVPQRVNFDFLFEDVEGEWMIYGLNIGTQPSPAVAAPEPEAPKRN